MKKLCVLTGAGMSAESGIKTFRDSGGLWEEHDVMTVASIEGWYQNPQLVLKFYNDRRRQLESALPNPGHHLLAGLQEFYEVIIVTQNVDNLHERAGSKHVLHLHGELTKAQSTSDPSLVYDIGYKDIHWGDTCEKGSQLRPFIVWFGEAVPAFEKAIDLIEDADVFAVIGTSLNVYPAAGLLNYLSAAVPIFIIDPKEVPSPRGRRLEHIREGASKGTIILQQRLASLFESNPL